MKTTRTQKITLLLLGFCLPLIFWPGSTSYEALKFTLLAVVVAVWFALAARDLRRGEPSPPVPFPLLILWMVLVLALAVGFHGAENPALVVRMGLLLSLFGIVGWQAWRFGGDGQFRTRLLVAMVSATILAAGYGWLQMAGILPGAPAVSGFPPAISTLGNQNLLSGLSALTLWPAGALLLRIRGRGRQALVGAAMLVSAATLILCSATGPVAAVLLVALSLTLPLILAIRGRSRAVPLALGMSLLLVLGATAVGLVDAGRHLVDGDAPHRRMLLDNSGDYRVADWRTAWSMFQRAPWTGVGAGNYLLAWPEARSRLDNSGIGLSEGAPVSTRAHNDLLQWLAETGLAGLLTLMLALFYLGRAWARAYARAGSQRRLEILLLTGAPLTALFHGLVSYPLHVPSSALVVVLCLGMLLAPPEENQESRPGKPDHLLAGLLTVLAVVLLAGSLRQFQGDLQVASGRKSFLLGRPQEALQQLDRGLSSRPWPGHAHLYRALALDALERPEEARAAYARSLRHRPTFQAHLALAEAAIETADPDATDHHLSLVLGCAPDRYFQQKAAFLSGWSELRQGRLVQARATFGSLLAENPDHVRTLLGLGYLETLEGQDEQARALYTRALTTMDRLEDEWRRDHGSHPAARLRQLQQNREVARRALADLE